ncbi:MAG: ABC transporter ATP-binding protein [Candidatus Zixiibacteriota bacterium]
MRVIEVQNLTKVYTTHLKKGNVVALDQVSLGVDQGEIFGLLGPNGAGKTTLVKALLGITRPTAGDILINGLRPDDPASRSKVGFLQENPRFPEHLTGCGLLRLAGQLAGMSESTIADRSLLLLELVGMGKWADTKTSKYSKGMTQRIGLAQALIADPDIVILDEPTDGIDPIGKVETRDVLKRIRDQGKTVFLNSHLLGEVELVADRVAILSRGRLVKVATVNELTVRDNVYEIEADIGNIQIDVPENIGKIVLIKTTGLTIELVRPENINFVVDQLRLHRINIWSVQPARLTLERSFVDAVSEYPGESA